MGKDFTDVMRDTLANAVRDATKSVGLDGKGRSRGNPLAGPGGVAAGAGLATLAPLAAKGAVRLVRRRMRRKAAGAADDSGGGGPVARTTRKLGEAVGQNVGDKLKHTVEESGGVAGVAKRVGQGMLPSLGGGDGGGGKGAPGVGEGRRMPVQQAMDVAVPIETCYNQWTQFEEWPRFMHRVTEVTQDDPCTVSFSTKIWANTKRFTAKIVDQRPEERIRWRVEDGISHTGVVTFHELAPRLTRVEMTVDVDPGSLLEKAARGMRHIKRAMRGDMHRFKAFIEMQELESGAWRGVIEDGELVEDHDPAYDEERDYGGAPGEAPSGESDADRPEEGEDEDAAAEPAPAAARAEPPSVRRRRAPGRRGADGHAAGERRRRPVAAGRS